MLTVLHRKHDGSETILEVESVTRLKGGDASIPPMGNILLRGVQLDCIPGNEIEIENSQPTTSENPFNQMVFVMNRFGATVARYEM